MVRHQPSRHVARVLLATFLAIAGSYHLRRPDEYLGQVPTWLPWRPAIIVGSGLLELALAIGLLAAPRRHRAFVGWITAGFLVAIFPGNVNQAITGSAAFGLDSPASRWGRLLFQPLFIAWALWSTGAWPARRRGQVSVDDDRGDASA